MVYYNEIDPFASQWLWNLTQMGVISEGVVDDRSVLDVIPTELSIFDRCHFFAGIGVWDYALRTAGWPEDRPVWTGSCPCQPFSSAGKGKGFADERHLWPYWFHLIKANHPEFVFGEQVASKDGLAWLDLVQSDLESEDYTVGAVDTCAAGFGAPHIRQRLYWVAYSQLHGYTTTEGRGNSCKEQSKGGMFKSTGTCAIGRMGYPRRATSKRNTRGVSGAEAQEYGERGAINGGVSVRSEYASSGMGGVVNSNGRNSSPERQQCGGEQRQQPEDSGCGNERPAASPSDCFWGTPDWLFCRDGKWRPVESAFKQMVDGLTVVMGYLRDHGTKKEVKEIVNATANHPYTVEILRKMWENDPPEKAWLTIGRQIGFYETTLLFAFVLQYTGKLGYFINCAEKGSTKKCSELLRTVWTGREGACTSCGPGYSQQLSEQLNNTLPQLPQTGAFKVLQTLNGFPLAHGTPNRVGRLRGYGNAIVAPQATEFVRAVMEEFGIESEVSG